MFANIDVRARRRKIRRLRADGGFMIIREWRGRASRSGSDAYPAHFRSAVVPELRKIPGFLGACLSQRQRGDQVEFLVLTRWQSMDAIRLFAGSAVDKAVVEPGAVAALIDFDDSVQHYEVIEDVSVPAPSL
jgi:heme-degrading monooxygenase HmoA